MGSGPNALQVPVMNTRHFGRGTCAFSLKMVGAPERRVEYSSRWRSTMHELWAGLCCPLELGPGNSRI